MGSYVISVHDEVANNWEPGKAIVGNNLKADTHFGSINSYVNITTVAYFPPKVNDTFPITIQYPPPPEGMNLKSKEQVQDYLASLGALQETDVFINMDGDQTPQAGKTYIAITENVGILGWGIAVALSCLFIFCIGGVIVFSFLTS